MIKLTIPYLPKSGNTLQNYHWAERKEYNDNLYSEVMVAWRYYREDNKIPKLPFEKAKIVFTLYFGDRRVRDKDNYVRGLKPMQDSLVHQGIIKDDRWDAIQTEYYQRYDKEHPRTEILIEEVR